jgi:hypothetical protein
MKAAKVKSKTRGHLSKKNNNDKVFLLPYLPNCSKSSSSMVTVAMLAQNRYHEVKGRITYNFLINKNVLYINFTRVGSSTCFFLNE